MRTRTSAKDVSRYLVWLAATESVDEPYLTPLKLQKLLYFVQGWTLAEWQSPMFTEQIEAWRDGPVVREVIESFGKALSIPITAELGDQDAGLSADEKAMIRSVWDRYKHLSGIGLRDLTHHHEPPYIEVYEPQDQDGRCNKKIDTDRIRRSFEQRLQQRDRRWALHRSKLVDAARLNTQRLIGKDAV